MPNHTSCFFRIDGAPETLKLFKEKARHENMIFALSAFFPCPKELQETSFPVQIVSQSEYDKAVIERNNAIATDDSQAWMFTLPLTEELQKEYKAKFGFDNWYDWAGQTWGTKWDVYKVSCEWKEIPFKNQMAIICLFQSAWSPPIEGITKISNEPQWKDLNFYIVYADEGGGFLGYAVISDGKVQIKNLPNSPWNGPEQVEVRKLCGQTVED